MQADPVQSRSSRDHLDVTSGLFKERGGFQCALPPADHNHFLSFERPQILMDGGVGREVRRDAGKGLGAGCEWANPGSYR